MNANIKSTLATIASVVLASISFGSAQAANIVSGSLWHVPEATAVSPTFATPANVPLSPPDVTFDVNSPMNFFGTDVSVGTWLASSSATITSLPSPALTATLASLMDDGINGTILQFLGFVTVTNGQSFTVTHDDGLTLVIGSVTVISQPGPTPPAITNATYTGPSGNFTFQLVYGECCGGPAVLQIDLPFTNIAVVPEPTTLALLGLGLAGLGFSRRRMSN